MLTDINKAIKEGLSGLDELFTSDDERAKAEIIKQKLNLKLTELLIERNRSVALVSWVARWPDFIGCTLALGLLVDVFIKPMIAPWGIIIPDLNERELLGFAGTMLGLQGIGVLHEKKK